MSRWAAAGAIAMDFFFTPPHSSSLRRKVVNLSISSAARLSPPQHQIPVGMMRVQHGCRPERIPFKSSCYYSEMMMEDERGNASGRGGGWGGGGLCQSTQRGNSGCLQMFASALTDNAEQRSSLPSPIFFVPEISSSNV